MVAAALPPGRRAMRVSKRAASAAGALLALVAVARVLVLFLEALSAVRDERTRDAELLGLCQSGAARESPKMRSACLQAQADRASPIVLKAVLRAFNTAFEDFAASMSSPGKLVLVVVFALVSVYMPLSSVLRALIPADEIDAQQHVVVVAGDSQLTSPRQRLRKAVGALRFRKQKRLASPLIEDVDEEDGGVVTLDLGHDKAE
tara:strand:+ start:8634 stop:9245 length:612 start_codon:yes stop_codon:yes gene_type:complete